MCTSIGGCVTGCRERIKAYILYEEYKSGEYAFRLKIYSPLLTDGYDYMTGRLHRELSLCIEEGREFARLLNIELINEEGL